MGKFKYDKANAQYLYGNGKAVSNATMNTWARGAIENAKASLTVDTQKLVDRKVSINAWANTMRDHIRGGHRMMAKLAYGPNLSAKQAGRLGAIVKKQYKFLNNFVAGLKNKSIARDASAINRANLYLQSLWLTYQNELNRAKKEAGFTLAANNLDEEAANCIECPELTDKGYISIDDMPLIGFRACQLGCKCSIEYARE